MDFGKGRLPAPECSCDAVGNRSGYGVKFPIKKLVVLFVIYEPDLHQDSGNIALAQDDQIGTFVHAQVFEADLLKLMDEEEVAEFTKPVEETKPEVVETIPEITEPAPEEKPKSKNMLPAILTLIVLACGGGFFVFKKVQEKKKEQEAAKPDPDADYVDDDEDYGYDPEFEDDDADSSVDEDDHEPV